MSQYYNEDRLNEDRSKKLIVACANAKRDEVEKIIETNPNIRQIINDKNNMGETALHATATGGDHYIVQCLLDNGADPKISDRQGRTPLMRAAVLGNLDAVQAFVAHDESNIFDAGSTGQLPLHCACLISNLDLINQFIELDDEKKTLKAVDNEGNSPWLAAAQPPITIEVLEYLLDAGSQVDEQNNKGETALLLAARAGNNKAIKFLLDKGAKFQADKNGLTPLHETCIRKNMAGVKLFLELPNIDLEKATTEGETALTHACSGGDPEICKLLIQKNANVNKDCVHAAAKNNRQPIIRLLVQNKADINKKNAQGLTPLVIAIDENDPELVRFILECGATLDIKYTNEELSKKPIDAIGWAKARGYKDVEKVLKHAKREGCRSH